MFISGTESSAGVDSISPVDSGKEKERNKSEYVTIESLPTELLHRIFDFLPQHIEHGTRAHRIRLSDIAAASVVNRRWYETSRCWDGLTAPVAVRMCCLSTVTEHWPRLARSMYVTDVSNDGIDTITTARRLGDIGHIHNNHWTCTNESRDRDSCSPSPPSVDQPLISTVGIQTLTIPNLTRIGRVLEPLGHFSSLTGLHLRFNLRMTYTVAGSPLSLSVLSSMRQLVHLSIEVIDGTMVWATDTDALATLSSLETLKLENLFLRSLDCVGNIGLKSLDICLFDGVCLGPLARLTCLGDLKLLDDWGQKDIVPLSQILNLTKLSLEDFCGLTSIEPLMYTHKLQDLRLSRCRAIQDIKPLSHLSTTLKTLQLDRLNQLKDLEAISHLTSLTRLVVESCLNARNVRSLTTLSSCMRDLTLAGFVKTIDSEVDAHVDILPYLPNLNFLEYDRSSIRSIEPVRALAQNLRALRVTHVDDLDDITPLAQLTSLTYLRLSRCWGVNDITPIAALAPCLRNLEIGAMSNAENLTRTLATLTRLTCLEIRNESSFSNLTWVKPLASCLRILKLRRVISLESCAGLDVLDCLHTLVFENVSIRSIEQLSMNASAARGLAVTLRRLELLSLKHVVNIGPLLALSALRNVRIVGCCGIQENNPIFQFLDRKVVVLNQHSLT
eukprot:CFRG6974T1